MQGSNVHLIEADVRVLPDLQTEISRATLSIHVVEKKDRILKVMRLVTFSPEFTREFYTLVHKQLMDPPHSNYEAALGRVYAKNTSKQLLKESVAQCEGGSE